MANRCVVCHGYRAVVKSTLLKAGVEQESTKRKLTTNSEGKKVFNCLTLIESWRTMGVCPTSPHMLCGFREGIWPSGYPLGNSLRV